MCRQYFWVPRWLRDPGEELLLRGHTLKWTHIGKKEIVKTNDEFDRMCGKYWVINKTKIILIIQVISVLFTVAHCQVCYRGQSDLSIVQVRRACNSKYKLQDSERNNCMGSTLKIRIFIIQTIHFHMVVTTTHNKYMCIFHWG